MKRLMSWAHTLTEMQKRALIWFLMFPLLSKCWNLIGVYERRDCEMWWKERESERERLSLVHIMQLCCLAGHGRSFHDPLSKSFLPLLSLLSCLPLPEECILCHIPPSLQNINHISLRWFLPGSPPALSISLSHYYCAHSPVFSHPFNLQSELHEVL